MRYERLVLNLELNKKQAEKHHESLKQIPLSFPILYEEDTLKINYRFNINYIGDIDRTLEAINNILDDETVVKAIDHKEVLHGVCIVESLFNRLRELESKFPRVNET